MHSYALISFRFLFLSIWVAESDCNSDFKIVFNLMLSSTMALEQCESKIFNRCSYSRFYRKKRTRHKFEKERKKSTQDAETNWKKDEIKFKQTLVHIKNYYDFFPLYFRIVVGRSKKKFGLNSSAPLYVLPLALRTPQNKTDANRILFFAIEQC